MVKKFLRPYAGPSGNFLYADGNDLELLAKSSLRQLLTPEISELAQRPVFGFSMFAESLGAFAPGLAQNDTQAAEAT